MRPDSGADTGGDLHRDCSWLSRCSHDRLAVSADFSASARALRAPLQSELWSANPHSYTGEADLYPAELRGGFKDWSKAAEHLCVAKCRRPDDTPEPDLKRLEEILGRNRADRTAQASVALQTVVESETANGSDKRIAN
jgi:hypothetical protein